jgi:uncharacterized FAD-dependent dehydrogenase
MLQTAEIVVGAGPAGLCCLAVGELSLKPIVIERGEDVRGRRRDLKAINVDPALNEDSNIVLEKAEQERILTENYTHALKRGDVTHSGLLAYSRIF